MKYVYLLFALLQLGKVRPVVPGTVGQAAGSSGGQRWTVGRAGRTGGSPPRNFSYGSFGSCGVIGADAWTLSEVRVIALSSQ